ncbi:Protein of unknown function [Methanolobus vulcani]|jgi:hypothetical protein|uniref:DUF1638 domain-containing protein n=1 Tax=Methanolobus vulcani TaxID=38026 RepID=A0A7Z7B0W0_9EURY|nr:DUF1638 domain-containing protein [Methanolobus vulcani]MDK2826768.1 hypothetical protein [Methanolobus sp.]MDK2947818.1 hypothetical protein [Methanolobus sp.]SDG25989.1 Protein of unknown function [Methanolobus vulcani]
MPLLTILSCKILQDEIVHILENDSSVDEILVVGNGQEDDFVSKLRKAGLEFRLLSPAKLRSDTETYRNDPEKYTVMIYMVELALHEFPKILKAEIYKLIDELSTCSNAILMFYGLCGNVFDKIGVDFAHLEETCPVRILKDDTRTVDDCVGATLGGCAEYLATLKKFSEHGTFLFTPMFAHAWREIMRVDPEKPEKTIKMLKKVNKVTGYKRVAKVQTGLKYTENFDEKVDEFAEIFDFEVLEIEGGQSLFEKCYLDIKEEVLGRSQ